MSAKNNTSQAQPEIQAAKQKPDVMVEIAGGYLLGATIMSFLALWMTGLTHLAAAQLL
ncbi:MAG: hypothetical protein HY420_04795 [Candidatus Kerfeldbacteria bacterium]|nr:hypothetical protein [Candidatus Kerfeldbacteria bacterium]